MKINEVVKCTTNTRSGAVVFEGKCRSTWEDKFILEFTEKAPLKSDDKIMISDIDPDFRMEPDKHYIVFKENTNSSVYYVNPKYTEEFIEDDGSGMEDIKPVNPEDIPEGSLLAW